MFTPRLPLVLLFSLPLGMSVLAIVERNLLGPLLAVDFGILVVAAFDAALAWRVRIEIERQVPRVFSLGRRNKVVLRLRSRSRRTYRGEVVDDLFEHAIPEALPSKFVLPPGGNLEMSYQVTPRRRGAYELGDHWVRCSSPLGFWMRRSRLRARDTIRVYPDLQRIRTYDLLARQDRELALLRTGRRRGGEVEFERLREYSRDDEYRNIDWRATARHQRLIAREFQLESNQNLVFMLDAGRLMTAESEKLSLFDHALNATLMLGHVAVGSGDRVGLVGFHERVCAMVPLTGGVGATRRLIQASYDLQPRLVEADYDAAFEHVALRFRKRSLVVLFTQLVDDSSARRVLRRARALVKRHLLLIVVFRDREVESLLESSEGVLAAYTQGAAAEIVRWQEGVLERARVGGALVLSAYPGQLTGQLITRYLEIKARHLL